MNLCQMEAEVTWFSCDDFPGYEVSNDGRVHSMDRMVLCGNGPRQIRGRELKPTLATTGYLVVKIRNASGKRRTVGIHTLLCTALHGPRPPRQEVRHLNGVKTANRDDNLKWGTKAENAKDAVRHRQHPNARKETCPQGHRYDLRNKSGRRCSKCRRAEYLKRRSAA